MRTIVSRQLAACLGFVVFLATAALAAPLPLTDHDDPDCVISGLSTNADGTLVFFESTCDLTSENGDLNREIFQVGSQGGITQLTLTESCTNANPSASAAGDRVAFDSDCPYVANADGSIEIFLLTPGGILQLTNALLCNSTSPSITAAGNLVAFDSDCDLVGGNFDQNTEIFAVTSANVVTQLTSDESLTGCGSFAPSVNASGNAIVFDSDCDFNGMNVDNVSEIFRVSPGGLVTQLTMSPDDDCASFDASIAVDDGRVTFESDCDYAGGNGDGSVEVFLVSVEGEVSQVTSAGAGCESSMPTIGGNGNRIAYVSYCDPYGTNTDGGLEIFRSAFGSGQQITETTSCANFDPRIARNGDLVTFVSDCNFDGSNDDGSYELVQAATCACGAPLSRNKPMASDALLTLQVAVGSGSCGLCECDVTGDERITAADALLILKGAVGDDVSFTCP